MTYPRGRSYGSTGSANLGTIGALLFVVAFVGGIGWEIYWNLGPKQGLHNETITVCSAEDSKNSDGHEYRIYAAGGTYKMADSWFGVERRNTADDYGKLQREIKKGPVTYDITAKGERWHTPTNLPNIVKFTKSAVQHPELCSAD